DDSPIVQRLAWKAPEGDPDAPYKKAAQQINTINLASSFARTWGRFETPSPVRWEDMKAESEAKVALERGLAAEVETSAAEYELAKRDAAATLAEIADLEKKIRVAETKQRREDYAEHSRQVDTLARQRATEKGRAAVTAKDRAWAAERIAKGGRT
ncbi:MAG TPA: hypothetical protein VIY73_10960, partial [Polyangiaceae bacterium]